ncbi:hypothetical protein FA95DRAFT_1022561 [Auriscalpium vulgare]|uniref:Uncharacterized protein n=1 Tax=Auriscalpium vulgare TaxID=40419 RepID=A0ACB8RXS8_9AGAM|nr:hypothetical protein FA95DRAFT_1022561 [Auriscalpium vulgare]
MPRGCPDLGRVRADAGNMECPEDARRRILDPRSCESNTVVSCIVHIVYTTKPLIRSGAFSWDLGSEHFKSRLRRALCYLHAVKSRARDYTGRYFVERGHHRVRSKQQDEGPVFSLLYDGEVLPKMIQEMCGPSMRRIQCLFAVTWSSTSVF